MVDWFSERGPAMAGWLPAELTPDCDSASVAGSLRFDASAAVFAGHFPGQPIVPGVFLVEAARMLLACVNPAFQEFSSVFDLRLLAPCRPGEPLRIDAVAENAQRWHVVVSRDCRSVMRCRLDYAAPADASVPAAVPVDVAINVLSTGEIMRRLPHRPPILLVDRAHEAPDGALASFVAFQAVSKNKLSAVAGGSTFPHVLLLESFAQAAGVAIARGPCDSILLLGGLRSLEIFGQAVAGDVLEHRFRSLRHVAGATLLDGETCVAGRVVCAVRGLLVTFKSGLF
jgi:3-hydroxyacyl-[acyl-carrier-protein] dehydratase